MWRKKYLHWVMIVGNLFAYFNFCQKYSVSICFVAKSTAIGADVNTVSTIHSKLYLKLLPILHTHAHMHLYILADWYKKFTHTQMSEMSKILEKARKPQRIIYGIFSLEGQWTGIFYCDKKDEPSCVNKNERRQREIKQRLSQAQCVMCNIQCAKSVRTEWTHLSIQARIHQSCLLR